MTSKEKMMSGVGLARVGEMHLVQLPKPTLQFSTDVIIRTIVAGVCGSDLHCLRGLEPCDVNTVFGHEVVGQIVECGEDVISFKVGDIVMTPFTTACGSCHACKHDMSARCVSATLLGWRLNGKGLQGTQAEYVRIPGAEGTLLCLTEKLHPEEGLLVGDILSTAAFCAMNAGVAGADFGTQARAVAGFRTLLETTRDVEAKFIEGSSVEKSDVYAVIGCGPVGLLAIMCIFELHELGWKARQRGGDLAPYCLPLVFAVDSLASRLETAKLAGAVCLNLAEGGEEAVLSAIKAQSPLGAVDAVLECVGGANLNALALGFSVLKPGGTLAAVGVPAPGVPFPFTPADCYDKNVTFVIGRCPSRSMMPLTLELLIRAKARSQYSRALTLAQAREAVITHRLTLSEGPSGYELFNNRTPGCTKVSKKLWTQIDNCGLKSVCIYLIIFLGGVVRGRD